MREVILKNFQLPLITIAALTLPAGLLAQESPDPLQWRAFLGVEHDSNVLRTASAQQSDFVTSAGLGLRFDKRAGLQRFRGDVEAATFRYDELSNLNYSTINYSAAWDWRIGSALHGVASADRRQFREVTTDSITGTNRIGRRTERSEVLDAIYDIDGAWRALAGVTHTRASSTEPNSYDASPSITTAHIGGGYEFASGSSMQLRYKSGDGHYTALSTPGPSDFRDQEVEFLLKWPVATGKTAVEARLAHIDRSNSGAPLRDFSGLVGGLTVAWDITGKTRLVAAASRDLSGVGQSPGGHVVSNRLYLSPVWKATAKTAFNLRFEHTRREWRDTPAGSPDAGRAEAIQVLGAGVEWEPVRKLAVTGGVRREHLKSSIVTAGYRATVYSLGLKAYF
ncbi:MAG: outer membrane beta-barrel protein [Pseudomonadota bacterium]